LAVAAWIALLQPIEDTPPLYTNPPDEHSRYLIPTYICKYLRLPNGFEPEVQIPYYGGSYALFPGLSYLFMGLNMRLVSGFGADAMLLAARSVNLFFGMLMALFVWLLGRRLFSERGTLWSFCCGIMYLPQLLFLHTYVNVESMCMLSIAVMLYGMIRMMNRGIRTVPERMILPRPLNLQDGQKPIKWESCWIFIIVISGRIPVSRSYRRHGKE